MSAEILLFQEIQTSSHNFKALPQALHSPSPVLHTVGSSPLQNNTQSTFSAWRGHRAGHSLSEPPSQCVFEVTQPHTMFPKIITHHSPCAFLKWHLLSPSSGIEGGTEDCEIFRCVLHQWNEERTWHTWSELLCWLLCCLPKRYHSTEKEQAEPMSCSGEISCIIFLPWHWHKYLLCSPWVFNSLPPLKLPSVESRSWSM